MLALAWAAQHFQSYRLGRSFLARTDHHALKWLHSFKEPEGQVAQWLELLSRFDFTVSHRARQKKMLMQMLYLADLALSVVRGLLLYQFICYQQ